MKLTFVAPLLAALAAASVAYAQDPTWGPTGYLAADAFDILAVLPAAPAPDDARGEADRAIFRDTRVLQGTPRWDLATRDVTINAGALLHDYSCALGVSLTTATAPKVTQVVTRAAADTSTQSNRAKNHYRRQRPYAFDQGETCQPREELAHSFDYPSGHTTYGWTWATLLSRLAPDRATQILARGRSYGESRVVCGVHNYSAVQAGYLTSTATLAAVEEVPAFKADLEAARAELAALRADPATPRPDAAQCAAEAELIAQPIL